MKLINKKVQLKNRRATDTSFKGLDSLISTVRSNKVVAESKAYKKIPVLINFVDENGVSHMKEMIQENYNYIKAEVKQIVADKLERIRNNDRKSRFAAFTIL